LRALELLKREKRVDLVITDHAMPGMSGTELAAQLQALRPELPVLLATGYADLPNGQSTTLPRLEKPFHLEKLAATIAALLPPRPTARCRRSPPPTGPWPRSDARFCTLRPDAIHARYNGHFSPLPP
jgi:DNA-binding NtrC family response regulator